MSKKAKAYPVTITTSIPHNLLRNDVVYVLFNHTRYVVRKVQDFQTVHLSKMHFLDTVRQYLLWKFYGTKTNQIVWTAPIRFI